jgi:16S rRNA (guanine527-N7)-methyltransferase
MTPFTPTAAQKKQLETVLDHFLEVNTRINLSAIRDKEIAWEKHILDSLAAVPIFEQVELKAKILDLGTGGGFPLLALTVVFPFSKWFGLDSVGKKTKAVSQIANTANMHRVKLLTGRAEEFGRNPHFRETFDIVTARAVAKYPTLLEIASPFIKPRGLLILWRGPECGKDDIELAKKLNLHLQKKCEYELTGGEKRFLWVFQKQGELKKKFPRAVGIPKKTPLALGDF